MQGYITKYLNLNADNLRDRYDNGFPILMEPIHNADDASARTIVYARHLGFSDAVRPPIKEPSPRFFLDGGATLR